MSKTKRSARLPARPSPTIPLAENVPAVGSRGLLIVYSLTVFTSAFLLFQVQPLIGKYILPWFGGTPGVWTTCMLVFQVLLFGGYVYAHLTSRWLGPRAQAALHTALLVGACVMLPIIPSETLKPSGSQQPIVAILVLLGLTVGLPFLALSTTGPLLQEWLGRTHPGRTPYRLYALSNAASLLALLTFPAVFEWLFATTLLAKIWSVSFGVFAVLCAISAWGMASRAHIVAASPARTAQREAPAPTWKITLMWFFLAMVPSTLLVATTNQVCLDVASVPFLWVLPLTLYLMSFIFCFESERWYSRRFLMPATVVALGCTYAVLARGIYAPLEAQVSVLFVTFLLCAMVCHGELFACRPHPQHLTMYYLVIAAGGAAGGIFVGAIAPLLFTGYYELHVGLFACVVLMLLALYVDPKSRFSRGRPSAVWITFLLAAGVFGAMLLDNTQDEGGYQTGEPGSTSSDKKGYVLAKERTFYGILRVKTFENNFHGDIRPARILINGRTTHGFEFIEEDLWSVPTTYYDEPSGIGRVLSHGPADKPRRVGVVGLGIGTLAAYARSGDTFRFYEINESVERIARDHFHYLDRCRGKVDVVIGDARLSLEREPEPQNFDVLVLDAFSSDAIPVHLLTREAFGVYLRHLAPNGILAVHLSSLHFALRPVAEAAGEAHRLSMLEIQSPLTGYGGLAADWELFARSSEPLSAAWLKNAGTFPGVARVLWTDDHASLLRAWLDR